MKASKNIQSTNSPKKVEASEEIAVVEELVPTTVCKYENAINLIAAAVESLAEVARDDEIAKDSIANLGVVLLDLKGGCTE